MTCQFGTPVWRATMHVMVSGCTKTTDNYDIEYSPGNRNGAIQIITDRDPIMFVAQEPDHGSMDISKQC